MRFEDLSPADQQLLRTDFGDLDKVASEQVAQAADCYNQGFHKLAAEIADAQDEADEMDKQAAENPPADLSPEAEKVAAELGAITEKGAYDGLMKLGSDRHGDPMHYFWPMIEQKIAQAGAEDALEKAASALGKFAEQGPEGHKLRRALLGNPVSAAIEAKKGKKMDAFGKAYKHQVVEGVKGLGKGAVGGAALGAAAGAVRGAVKGGRKGAMQGAATGAGVGGYGGAAVGGNYGAFKGTLGAEASRIHGEHSKHKK